MDWLRRTFEGHQFLQDEREPALSFRIVSNLFVTPWLSGLVGVVANDTDNDVELQRRYVEFEILAPNPMFSVMIVWILFLQMVIGSLLAVIIYYGIIIPASQRKFDKYTNDSCRRPQQSTSTSTSTTSFTTGLLFGYGVIVPFTLGLPLWVVDQCNIRNVGFRLGWCSLPLTLTLRCLEAMHGTLPPHRTTSLWAYVRSTGFILQPKYVLSSVKKEESSGGDNDDDDDGDVYTVLPMTLKEGFRILREYGFWLLTYTAVYHCLSPFDFSPFATPGDPAMQPWFYWDLPHLYDTYLQACMVSVTLSLSMTGISSLSSLLTGVQVEDRVTDHPMFLSESVSEFWGRRWNNLIHVCLKQGVYKPVRAWSHSRTLAALAAFVVSGLYHEYVWVLLFAPTAMDRLQVQEGVEMTDHYVEKTAMSLSCCSTCYCHGWAGKQLAFFAWNGMLIALEYCLGDRINKWMRSSGLSPLLPRLLRCHLIVMLSLPVGHLFTQDLIHAGYVEMLREAIPIVRVASSTTV